MSVETEQLQAWIGREERGSVRVDPATVSHMAALLDWQRPPQPGDPLPCLWHWLFLAQPARSSDIGHDGHPVPGGFLPKLPLWRRMWAGSRLQFGAVIRIGETIDRLSSIEDVKLKNGKSGPLAFVTVRHEISVEGRAVIEELQDIAYRDPSPRVPSAPAPHEPNPAPQFSRVISPHPVLLFRYSALTFNAHRIHYDRDYAVRDEGYPGLVVQAPLTATLLLDLVGRGCPDAQIEALHFRALKPLFDLQPFSIHGRREGREASLWAEAPDGAVALTMKTRLR